MSTPEPQQQFLKPEDLHNLSSASPASSSFDGCTAASASPPPPVIVQSKPAKKRKSWGQELPEPKTNLPPRKRAKTDDEKEQRRIERIKRNRAAAHNSRERKRQETETLAVALARANAELDAYRKLHGPLPSNIILPEVTLSSESPSLEDSQPCGSADDQTSRAASPVDSLFKSSPRAIKQEPLESSFPVVLPPAFENLEAKLALSLTSSPLDPTQHSAAMLCDLQCRSSRCSLNPSSPSISPNSWWTQLILSLMTFQLQTCYKTLLVALWTLSPSRMARMATLASMRLMTSGSRTSSTIPHPSQSTRRRLALSDSATGLRGLRGIRGAPTAPQRSSVDDVRPTGSEGRQQDHHHRLANREDRRCRGDKADQNDGVDRGRVT